jgi:peptidyl-prolyl cis-trans isomerase B (cyclophilin B)
MRLPVILAGVLLAFASIAGACKNDDNSGVPTPDLFDDTPTAVQSGGETPSVDATPTQGAIVGTLAERCPKSTDKQFAGPDTVIDTGKSYVATIKTDKGDIVVELYIDTPITTNNFVFLSCKGFYDGLTFHRVVANFVIQGGDPTGSGSGGPGYAIPDEDDGDHKMIEGVISMAKSGPDTTGSQFFVTIGLGDGGSLDYLDPDFTVFGEVTSGLDVAKAIAQGDTINTVEIVEQ